MHKGIKRPKKDKKKPPWGRRRSMQFDHQNTHIPERVTMEDDYSVMEESLERMEPISVDVEAIDPP